MEAPSASGGKPAPTQKGDKGSGFDIVWNSPWPTACPAGTVRPAPDFARFGIRTNAHAEFNGDVVHTIYCPTSFSTFPHYAEDAPAVGLKVQDNYTRAAPGGVGYAKTAGNYAASLLPGDQSRREGFDQALWLDGAEHKYVEEVGQMNIFFHLGDKIVTPELRGTILPGVTRESVSMLLRDNGYEVEERRIHIDEIVNGIATGDLKEAFGSGTATVIAPVGRIGYQGETHLINQNTGGPVAEFLYDQILGIQLGEVPDPYGWTQLVSV